MLKLSIMSSLGFSLSSLFSMLESIDARVDAHVLILGHAPCLLLTDHPTNLAFWKYNIPSILLLKVHRTLTPQQSFDPENRI
jgi:hypothetical protein